MKFNFFRFKPLYKASLYNLIIVIVKSISAVITSKVFAIVLGPTGLALMGNFRNFAQGALAFTSQGYQNGVIRCISQQKANIKEQKRVLATIFQLSMAFALFMGVIICLGSGYWSELLFRTDEYKNTIKVFGIGLPFISFNLLFIYIFNGLELYRKVSIITSVLFVVNMAISVLLTVKWELKGALVSVTAGPVLAFLVIFFLLGKERSLFLDVFNFKSFDIKVVKKMSLYFFMAVYSMLISSVTFLSIRNLIIENLSSEDAGYWEAMNRISVFYLMFFTSLTSFYLLPKLSKIDEIKLFKKEIKSFYGFAIPLLLVSFIAIYFLRFFILKLLLSDAFLQTANLFFWQLVGDFISVLAIVLVKQFHAKLMVKAYIICNGTLNILYFLFSSLFIDMFGLVGVSKAYALSYFIYFVMVLLFVYFYFKKGFDV